MKGKYKHFIILNLEQKRNKTRGENPGSLHGRIFSLPLYFARGFSVGTNQGVSRISYQEAWYKLNSSCTGFTCLKLTGHLPVDPVDFCKGC